MKLARHWLAAAGVLLALYAGMPFAAPLALHYGLVGLADPIYAFYASPVCHQFAFRSWFLFGEQTVYPRALANVPGVETFEQMAAAEPAFAGIEVTSLNPRLVQAARLFRGSDRIGWKVALCQRDVGIYASLALFTLIYGLLRRARVRMPYLPLWAYMLIAIAPIGLDGFSQLFSNSLLPGMPPGLGLSFYPIRESTPLLRVLTGTLFGIGNGWLAFPYIEESMAETYSLIETRLIRAGVIPPRADQRAAND